MTASHRARPRSPVSSSSSRRARRVVASSSDLPKLYIPADVMGGESPELKAAKTLRRLFTFVAIRVVQGHIEARGTVRRDIESARAEKGPPEKTETDGGTRARLSLAQTADSPRKSPVAMGIACARITMICVARWRRSRSETAIRGSMSSSASIRVAPEL